MKAKVEFKGIVKGAFSKYQAVGYEEAAVMRFEGETIEETCWGLALEEWTFILKVNGKRIKDVFAYIKRKGLDIADYTRPAEVAL